MADKAAEKDYTPRELEIMAKAWNCMVEEPKVDYAKLAQECGMTNVRSASNAWGAIKKKLLSRAGGISKTASTGSGEDGNDANGSAGGGGAETPNAKATPRKRGKKEGAEGESPTKKVKGSAAKKGKKDVKAENLGEGEGEGTGEGIKAELEVGGWT